MRTERSIDVIKNRLFTKTPYKLFHLVTSKCECKCQMCDLWKKAAMHKNDLTTEEVFQLLDDAKEAGIKAYTCTGGEPLLRGDLPRILDYAKKLGMAIYFASTGIALKERYREIMPYLDLLAVSIDAADDLHDEMRGIKGLRKRAIEGIKLCKEGNYDTSIVINSVISNVNTDKIDGLMKMSKELDLPIFFHALDVTETSVSMEPTEEQTKEAFKKIIEYKKAGYKVSNPYYYLKQFSKYNKNFVCHAPQTIIHVEANGDILSCDHVRAEHWGNVKSMKLKDLFKSKDFKELYYKRKKEKCTICNNFFTSQTSFLYTLNPKTILEVYRNKSYYK